MLFFFVGKSANYLVMTDQLFLQFKLISHAYEVLSDPKRRETYDRGGEEAIKGGGSGSGFDFHSPMDIFDMFFGGGGRGGGRQRGPQKGKDVIHQMKVSLEDFYNGCTRKLSLKKKVICAKCEGKEFDMNFVARKPVPEFPTSSLRLGTNTRLVQENFVFKISIQVRPQMSLVVRKPV